MTPQQIATERLAGWHAAERGDVFDFRRSKEWTEGHMLWTEAHVALPVFAAQHSESASTQSQVQKAFGPQPKPMAS